MKIQQYQYKGGGTQFSFQFLEDSKIVKHKRNFIKLLKQATKELEDEIEPVRKGKKK